VYKRQIVTSIRLLSKTISEKRSVRLVSKYHVNIYDVNTINNINPRYVPNTLFVISPVYVMPDNDMYRANNLLLGITCIVFLRLPMGLDVASLSCWESPNLGES